MRKRFWRKVRANTSLLLFLSPTLIFVIVFLAYPLFYSGYLSFTKFNFATENSPTFVGFQTYKEVILDENFHISFINSLKFAIPYFTICFSLSLLIAILIHQLIRGNEFFQMIFYFPIIVPLSLVGVIFVWIYEPDIGILNVLLRKFGLSVFAKRWLADSQVAIYSMIIAQSWQQIGFTVIIFLSGLQSISTGIYDAAKVDGANFIQETWYITLPNLKFYSYICGLWIAINAWKVFEMPAVMTKGGPGIATTTLYYHSWKAAFRWLEMGKSSAIAYLTALTILIMSLILKRLFRTEMD